MAFFKFRKAGEEPAAAAAPAPQPESVEVMRRRAMHRLLGAAVLVLAGVIGFPLLFDRQPRPIPVDTPIEVPDRNKVPPLSIPAPAARNETQVPPAEPMPAPAGGAAASVSATKPASAPDLEEEVIPSPAKPASAAATGAALKASPASSAAADKPAKPASAAAATAAAETKTELAEGRYVVQIGAFAEVPRAREARLKVEAAGLKTYTQVVETKEGRRIRVRVGPYAGKPEADKAAETIRKLGLPAAILTL